MKTGTIVFLLVVTGVMLLVLSFCIAPTMPAGTAVETKDGAVGCQIWVPPDLIWEDCSRAGNLSGVVEDHPDGFGHAAEGRIRVHLEGTRGILWFERRDLTVAPEK